jgi:hypothetical protein
MRSVFWGLVICAASGLAQTTAPQPDPAVVLQRARARLLTDANRMPRYTCEQNITRQFYRAEGGEGQTCASLLAKREERKHELKRSSWDRLQLDVAIGDNSEIHSWPGSREFNEDEARKLVSNGPFGSGDFRAFVAAIFGGSATVSFAGAHKLNGRTLFDYLYAVTQSASRYRIDVFPGQVLTAYDGSFLLDPQTGDLAQLTVRTAELPPATQACQATSEIEYGRIDIHGREVLIPRQTDLHVVYRDGGDATTATTYSSCHEYASQSTLRFDISSTATASDHTANPTAARSPLPLGLRVDCRIVTPIDSATSPGQRVEAILRSPLRDDDSVILAPVGANIRGRLIRLAEYKGKRSYFEADLVLNSIEIGGTERPLYAMLSHYAAPHLNDSARNSAGLRLLDLQMEAPRNVGVFLFGNEHPGPREWDSTWITTAPESASTIQRRSQKEPSDKTQAAFGKQSAQNFMLAIHYSQQAADLLRATPTGGSLADYPKLQDLLAYRRNAIAAAKATDTDLLNDVYPGLGDKFKSQFLEALTLLVHGCELDSRSESAAKGELSRGTLLYDEWTNWYGPHRGDIDAAVIANSGGMTASPTSDTAAPSKD